MTPSAFDRGHKYYSFDYKVHNMTSFVLGKQGVTDSLIVGNNHKHGGGGGLGKIIDSPDTRPVLRPSNVQSTKLDRPAPVHTNQYTPSVSFSDLDTFANPERVLTRDPDDIELQDFGYGDPIYNDEHDEDYNDTAINHTDSFQPTIPPEMDTAIKHANNAQPTQSFTFMDSTADCNNNNNEQNSTCTERVQLLAKLKRRNSRRKPHEQEHINPNASINDLRIQAAGASYETKSKTAVLMLRRITMFIAKIIETISTNYPEYLPELEGWSENVYLSLDSYDEMLYDIYDEYGHKIKSNPIITFIFALGSNAAMFAMTKKIMSNPITGHVMGNLAKQFSKSNSSGMEPAPKKTGDPAVPISTSSTRDVMEEPASFDIQGMLSGNSDISKLLGNFDMNKLLSGLGDVMGPMSNERIEVEPVVNPMKPMSLKNQKEVMDIMRTHQDDVAAKEAATVVSKPVSSLKTIYEDECSKPQMVSNENHEKKLIFD